MEMNQREKESWNDLLEASDDKKVETIRNMFIGCKNVDAYGTMMGALAQMIFDNVKTEEEACKVAVHLGKMTHVTVHALYAHEETKDENFNGTTH
jgi:hypothetical protein